MVHPVANRVRSQPPGNAWLRLTSPDRYVAIMARRHPLIGRSYRTRALRGVQRILMRATRYHVYYLPEAPYVVVLAVWGAVREQRPRLRGI